MAHLTYFDTIEEYNAYINSEDYVSPNISYCADAFYVCTGVTDVYCYPNPTNLTWDESGKDDFKSDGSTICHVYSQYLSEYQTKFGSDVNVTFVGDLT